MAETHILQNVIPLALALWWTKNWLMDTIVARWRFAVSAIAGGILWIYVAYSSTRAVDASSGVEIVFESFALAYFSVFMAILSVVGMLLGLTLWAEEEGERTTQTLPDAVQTQFGD